MKLRCFRCLWLAFSVFWCSAHVDSAAMAAEGNLQPVQLSRPELMKAISPGLEAMDRLYWSPTLAIWLDRPGNDVRAVFEGRSRPPWWVSANAVELVVDAMNLAGSSERDASLETLYSLWK